MKKLIILALTIFGCTNSKSTEKEVRASETVGSVSLNQYESQDIQSFHFKGHDFLACHVNNGMSFTHDPNCKFDKK